MSSPKPDGGAAGLGKARLLALEWLALKGPISWFTKDTPHMHTVKWLAKNGYAEMGKSKERFSSAMPFALTTYQISERGRAMITARQSS